MFDVREFAKSNALNYTTDHHHSTRGWIQIEHCPFCNSYKYHLGYNPKRDVFHCWKCGHHSLYDTLLAFGVKAPKKIIQEFHTDNIHIDWLAVKATPVTKVEYPKFTAPIIEPHRRYLWKRGFDPEEIEVLYKIQGTRHLGPDVWRSRIIIPVFYKNVLVTYQGRDITGKRKNKYKTLSKEFSKVNIKHTLYGMDNFYDDVVVVVEGVTDVWRLGPGAVAVYGTTYTSVQIKLLLAYKIIFVLFDKEEKAQQQASKLVATMKAYGRESENIGHLIDFDPGDLEDKEAKKLMRNLRGI